MAKIDNRVKTAIREATAKYLTAESIDEKLNANTALTLLNLAIQFREDDPSLYNLLISRALRVSKLVE